MFLHVYVRGNENDFSLELYTLKITKTEFLLQFFLLLVVYQGQREQLEVVE